MIVDVGASSKFVFTSVAISDVGTVDECERLNLSDSSLSSIKSSTAECMRFFVHLLVVLKCHLICHGLFYDFHVQARFCRQHAVDGIHF